MADEPSFLLGIRDSLEITEARISGIDDPEINIKMITEGRFDHGTFARPEQSVVNEDARELPTDGLCQQCRYDG